MGLNAEKKNFRQEMPAGVHLAVIADMKKQLDANRMPIVINGEMAVTITFSNGQNQYHDQTYWIGGGMSGKERFFTKMCQDAMVDLTKTPLSKKDAIGKRLWIAIKEVFTLTGDGTDIKKDITGNEIVEHFIFGTEPISDVDRAPKWPDSDFVSYKLEGQSGYESFIPGTSQNAVVIEELKPEEEMQKVLDNSKAEIEKITKPAFTDLIVKGETKIETPLPNFGDSPDDTFLNE